MKTLFRLVCFLMTGSVVFLAAELRAVDLTGASVTLTADNAGDYDGRLTNSSGTMSVVTFDNHNYNNGLGAADGSDANIQLVLINGNDRGITGTNQHTGGTVLSSGHFNVGDPVSFGPGDIIFGNAVLSTQANPSLTISNRIVLQAGYDGGFRVRNAANRSMVLTGQITGDGNLHLRYDNGALILQNTDANNPNNYTGDTYIGSQLSNGYSNNGTGTARLRLGAENSLPATTTVYMDNMTRAFLDLNGFSAKVADIKGKGSVVNTSTSGAVSTLTLAGNDDSAAFSYVSVGEKVAVRKEGTGVLALYSRDWRFTEEFDLHAGTLEFATTGSSHASETYKITGDAKAIVNANGQWQRSLMTGTKNYDTSAAVSQAYTKNMDAEVNTWYGSNGASGGLWPGDNHTYGFTTDVYLSQDTMLDFRAYFDDNTRIILTKYDAAGNLETTAVFDKECLYNTGNYNDNDVLLTEGKYLFEFYVDQGNGGVGARDSKIGMGVRVSGTSDYSALTIDQDGNLAFGDGSVLRVAEVARTIESTFDIDDGVTFTLEGRGAESVTIAGEIKGQGTLRLDPGNTKSMTLTHANAYSGGTQLLGSVTAADSKALGAGAVQLLADATITLDATDGSRTLGNAINLGDNTLTLRSLGANAANEALFAGRIQGSGTLIADGQTLVVDLNDLVGMTEAWYSVGTASFDADSSILLMATDIDALAGESFDVFHADTYILLPFENPVNFYQISSDK